MAVLLQRTRTATRHLRRGGYIHIQIPIPEEPGVRKAVAWRRFHSNPTLFQENGAGFGDSIAVEPDTLQRGVAGYCQLPVEWIELGLRVYTELNRDPRKQFKIACSRAGLA